MTRHRFILPLDALPQPGTVTGVVSFPEEQAHQIARVLRLRPGSTVGVADGRGGEWDIRLTDIGNGRVLGTIQRYDTIGTDAVASLTLYQSLLKATKYELILQKCTELGVHRFVAVEAARCVPSDLGRARSERFGRIVREAAEQSGRVTVPLVEQTPQSYSDAMREAAAEGTVIVLWEEEQILHLHDVPLDVPAEAVSLFVGPEGGFTSEEIDLARSCGAHPATLGPRVLRAETAAIVGSALVLARTGDLG